MILVVVLTVTVSEQPESESDEKKSTKLSTTMSLRPYRYNIEPDISVELSPRYTLDDFLKSGHEMRRQGNYKKAEDIFKTAMLFDKDNAETVKTIGELAYLDNRFGEASNYFAQYLVLKPDAIESYTNLAVSLIRGDDLASAEIITKKGLARLGKEQPGPLYLLLACINQRTKNKEKAEHFLTKAFESLGADILKLVNSSWAAPVKELDTYQEIKKTLSPNSYRNEKDHTVPVKLSPEK